MYQTLASVGNDATPSRAPAQIGLKSGPGATMWRSRHRDVPQPGPDLVAGRSPTTEGLVTDHLDDALAASAEHSALRDALRLACTPGEPLAHVAASVQRAPTLAGRLRAVATEALGRAVTDTRLAVVLLGAEAVERHAVHLLGLDEAPRVALPFDLRRPLAVLHARARDQTP